MVPEFCVWLRVFKRILFCAFIYVSLCHAVELGVSPDRPGRRAIVGSLLDDNPVPIYEAPQYDARVLADAKGATCTPIGEPQGEWLEVAVRGQDGVVLSGWLALHDVGPEYWAVQSARDGRHAFRVGYSRPRDRDEMRELEDRVRAVREGLQYHEDIYWEVVEVRNLATGKTHYIFDSTVEPTAGRPESLVSLVDVNFDGYPDLQLFGGTGGAGPNFSMRYYLFDPKLEIFVASDQLSNMTQLQIDPVRKTLLTAWRSSCCEHGWEEYRWFKGKLLKIRAGSDRYVSDGAIDMQETTKEWLSQGRWHSKTKREKIRRK